MIIDKTLAQIARKLISENIDFSIDFQDMKIELTNGDQFERPGFGEAYRNAAGQTELFIYGDEPDSKVDMNFFFPPRKPKPPKSTSLDKD